VNRGAPGGRAPWSTGDLVGVVAVVAAGAAVCAGAWTGASGHADFRDQKGWLALGVAGFLLAVAGQSWWLHRGRRSVAAHAALLMAEAAALAPVASGPAVPASAAERLVAADGMRRFHRPECPIAAGRGWSPIPRPVHEAAGRTPCGICRP